MEPRIQYAQTADGVSIAYWVLGEGQPFVHLSLVFSHIQMEWQFPECRRWYERLPARRKLHSLHFRRGGPRVPAGGRGGSPRGGSSFASTSGAAACQTATSVTSPSKVYSSTWRRWP